MQGCWSVRELKRQISSLYYERSGLSTDIPKLADSVSNNAETDAATLAIRDPYVFEFLGLKAKEVMSESDLEDQLLDKIESFLLELIPRAGVNAVVRADRPKELDERGSSLHRVA